MTDTTPSPERAAVLANIRPRRNVDDTDFSDLTTAVQTAPAGWLPGDVLVIPMDAEPTEAEKVKIRRRLVTVDAADEQRLQALIAAVPATEVERLWRDTELAKYGEVPPPPPTSTKPGKGKPAAMPSASAAGFVSTGAMKAGVAKNITVKYDVEFAVAPKVTPQVVGGDASVERRVTVVSESTTGCVLSVWRGTGTAAFDVNWIAVTP